MAYEERVFLLSSHNRYVCAEDHHKHHDVVADRHAAGPWETWTVVPLAYGKIAFRSHHGKYLCAEPSGKVIANRDKPDIWESWERIPLGPGKFAFRSYHGKFLCAEDHHHHYKVVANRDISSTWETFTWLPAGGPVGVPMAASVTVTSTYGAPPPGAYPPGAYPPGPPAVVVPGPYGAPPPVAYAPPFVAKDPYGGRIVTLRSHHGSFLCAENHHKHFKVVSDRYAVGDWERWYLTEPYPGKAILRSHHGRYLCAEPGGKTVADREVPKEWEHFDIVQLGNGYVALRSHHGKYLCAEPSGHVVCDRHAIGDWERWMMC